MKKFFNGNRQKYAIALLLTAVLFLQIPLELLASQTSSELKKAGQKIDELQEQKKEAEKKVGVLEEQENSLQGDLADFNQQLSEISTQINDLETQITDKQIEIEETSQQLEEAKQQKQQQYESMKLRIQFIYENGGEDMLAVLLDSKSIADILNRVEYVEAINRYDRQMLHQYEDTCEQVAEKEENLKTEKTELIALQETEKQKKTEVDSLIAKTKDNIAAKQNEISDAKDTVNDYDAQIAKMKAYEEELERKKAEEAKKRAEEQKKKEQQQKQQQKQGQSSENQGGGTVTANASDLAMLAALVECEAGGESYDGQWAVASVVVNRVRSGNFPNTISGVIYQGGQFSPVASGRFAVVLARGAGSSSTKAANAALAGNTNVTSLYFCRASSGVPGTVIGNHVFY